MIHVTDVLPWYGPTGDPSVLERGTHVHLACHLLDTAGLDWGTVHKPWAGYVRAWEKCREEAGITVIDSEVKVVSVSHGYEGRLDKLVQFGRSKRPWILDIKSGGVPATVGLQTAAYTAALEEGNRSGYRRAVVRLDEQGTYRLIREDTPDQKVFGPSDFRVFLAYLTVAKWEISQGYRAAPAPRE